MIEIIFLNIVLLFFWGHSLLRLIRLRLQTTSVSWWSEKADQPCEAKREEKRSNLAKQGWLRRISPKKLVETMSVSSLSFIWPDGKRFPLVYWPLSYFGGQYCVVLWMYLLSILGIHFSIMTIDIPLCLIAFLSLMRKGNVARIEKRDFRFEPMGAPGIWQKILSILIIAYILGQIFFVIWMALNVPIFEWDVIWRIGLKGKVLFFDQGIQNLTHMPYPGYSLAGPFMMSWASSHAGMWHENVARAIIASDYIMFIILFGGFLRVFMSSLVALIATALLISSNFFTYHATLLYNDFPVAIFLCSSIFCLVLWNKVKGSSWLLLSSVLMSMAGLFKLEAFLYGFYILVVGCFLFIGFQKQNVKNIIIFMLPWIAALLFHLTLCWVARLDMGAVGVKFVGVIGVGQRAMATFGTLSKELFAGWNWNVLWGLLLVLLVQNFRRVLNQPEIRMLALILLVFIGHVICASVFSDRFRVLGGTDAIQTLPRMILHFYPLCPALIAFFIMTEKEVNG